MIKYKYIFSPHVQYIYIYIRVMFYFSECLYIIQRSILNTSDPGKTRGFRKMRSSLGRHLQSQQALFFTTPLRFHAKLFRQNTVAT